MKKVLFTILAMLLVVPTAACSKTASAEIVESDKPRETAPATSPDDNTMLSEGNGEFAFDLYRNLKSKEGNFFYSPYSISAALGMTYAGARGETEQQMADTLHFTLPQDRLHPAFNHLDLKLESRGEGAQGSDDKGFRLSVANALWGQKGFSFLPDFLDTLAVNYGAGLRILDFAQETEISRLTINGWVSDETEGRIKDLIPQGVIDPSTRLVLTNAIYFNAAWQYPFEKDYTSNGAFTQLDGTQVTVPMMRQTEVFGYAEGDGYKAAELLYDGRELSMVILLPDEGTFGTFEESLNFTTVSDIIDSLTTNSVALTIPTFEFDSEFNLKETLSAMGMPVAFSGAADFSGMTGKADLYIDEVIHKAFVAVNEAGTEAAAATAVVMKESAMPLEQYEFTADHPFIFFIRDIETGAILFAGRILNPAG
jgi:serpin B